MIERRLSYRCLLYLGHLPRPKLVGGTQIIADLRSQPRAFHSYL